MRRNSIARLGLSLILSLGGLERVKKGALPMGEGQEIE